MRLYTFSINFRGKMDVWVEAESEDEARAEIAGGNWADASETLFEPQPELGAMLVSIEELDEEGNVIFEEETRG